MLLLPMVVGGDLAGQGLGRLFVLGGLLLLNGRVEELCQLLVLSAVGVCGLGE
ncbi:hypothetical protein ACIQ6K_26925 [Streptomyces sp. NPDC096354]|uniref:hypothetical protein n=1 Tax=Streptomyces sp. NPDC096354 TaxID=3366088 RepID=UPI00381E160D